MLCHTSKAAQRQHEALQHLREDQEVEMLRRYIALHDLFPANKDPSTAPVTMLELKALAKHYKLHRKSKNFWRTFRRQRDLTAELINYLKQQTAAKRDARGYLPSIPDAEKRGPAGPQTDRTALDASQSLRFAGAAASQGTGGSSWKLPAFAKAAETAETSIILASRGNSLLRADEASPFSATAPLVVSRRPDGSVFATQHILSQPLHAAGGAPRAAPGAPPGEPPGAPPEQSHPEVHGSAAPANAPPPQERGRLQDIIESGAAPQAEAVQESPASPTRPASPIAGAVPDPALPVKGPAAPAAHGQDADDTYSVSTTSSGESAEMSENTAASLGLEDFYSKYKLAESYLHLSLVAETAEAAILGSEETLRTLLELASVRADNLTDAATDNALQHLPSSTASIESLGTLTMAQKQRIAYMQSHSRAHLLWLCACIRHLAATALSNLTMTPAGRAALLRGGKYSSGDTSLGLPSLSALGTSSRRHSALKNSWPILQAVFRLANDDEIITRPPAAVVIARLAAHSPLVAQLLVKTGAERVVTKLLLAAQAGAFHATRGSGNATRRGVYLATAMEVEMNCIATLINFAGAGNGRLPRPALLALQRTTQMMLKSIEWQFRPQDEEVLGAATQERQTPSAKSTASISSSGGFDHSLVSAFVSRSLLTLSSLPKCQSLMVDAGVLTTAKNIVECIQTVRDYEEEQKYLDSESTSEQSGGRSAAKVSYATLPWLASQESDSFGSASLRALSAMIANLGTSRHLREFLLRNGAIRRLVELRRLEPTSSIIGLHCAQVLAQLCSTTPSTNVRSDRMALDVGRVILEEEGFWLLQDLFEADVDDLCLDIGGNLDFGDGGAIGDDIVKEAIEEEAVKPMGHVEHVVPRFLAVKLDQSAAPANVADLPQQSRAAVKAQVVSETRRLATLATDRLLSLGKSREMVVRSGLLPSLLTFAADGAEDQRTRGAAVSALCNLVVSGSTRDKAIANGVIDVLISAAEVACAPLTPSHEGGGARQLLWDRLCMAHLCIFGIFTLSKSVDIRGAVVDAGAVEVLASAIGAHVPSGGAPEENLAFSISICMMALDTLVNLSEIPEACPKMIRAGAAETLVRAAQLMPWLEGRRSEMLRTASNAPSGFREAVQSTQRMHQRSPRVMVALTLARLSDVRSEELRLQMSAAGAVDCVCELCDFSAAERRHMRSSDTKEEVLRTLSGRAFGRKTSKMNMASLAQKSFRESLESATKASALPADVLISTRTAGAVCIANLCFLEMQRGNELGDGGSRTVRTLLRLAGILALRLTSDALSPSDGAKHRALLRISGALARLSCSPEGVECLRQQRELPKVLILLMRKAIIGPKQVQRFSAIALLNLSNAQNPAWELPRQSLGDFLVASLLRVSIAQQPDTKAVCAEVLANALVRPSSREEALRAGVLYGLIRIGRQAARYFVDDAMRVTLNHRRRMARFYLQLGGAAEIHYVVEGDEPRASAAVCTREEQQERLGIVRRVALVTLRALRKLAEDPSQHGNLIYNGCALLLTELCSDKFMGDDEDVRILAAEIFQLLTSAAAEEVGDNLGELLGAAEVSDDEDGGREQGGAPHAAPERASEKAAAPVPAPAPARGPGPPQIEVGDESDAPESADDGAGEFRNPFSVLRSLSTLESQDSSSSLSDGEGSALVRRSYGFAEKTVLLLLQGGLEGLAYLLMPSNSSRASRVAAYGALRNLSSARDARLLILRVAETRQRWAHAGVMAKFLVAQEKSERARNSFFAAAEVCAKEHVPEASNKTIEMTYGADSALDASASMRYGKLSGTSTSLLKLIVGGCRERDLAIASPALLALANLSATKSQARHSALVYSGAVPATVATLATIVKRDTLPENKTNVAIASLCVLSNLVLHSSALDERHDSAVQGVRHLHITRQQLIRDLVLSGGVKALLSAIEGVREKMVGSETMKQVGLLLHAVSVIDADVARKIVNGGIMLGLSRLASSDGGPRPKHMDPVGLSASFCALTQQRDASLRTRLLKDHLFDGILSTVPAGEALPPDRKRLWTHNILACARNLTIPEPQPMVETFNVQFTTAEHRVSPMQSKALEAIARHRTFLSKFLSFAALAGEELASAISADAKVDQVVERSAMHAAVTIYNLSDFGATRNVLIEIGVLPVLVDLASGPHERVRALAARSLRRLSRTIHEERSRLSATIGADILRSLLHLMHSTVHAVENLLREAHTTAAPLSSPLSLTIGQEVSVPPTEVSGPLWPQRLVDAPWETNVVAVAQSDVKAADDALLESLSANGAAENGAGNYDGIAEVDHSTSRMDMKWRTKLFAESLRFKALRKQREHAAGKRTQRRNSGADNAQQDEDSIHSSFNMMPVPMKRAERHDAVRIGRNEWDTESKTFSGDKESLTDFKGSILTDDSDEDTLGEAGHEEEAFHISRPDGGPNPAPAEP